VLLALAEQQGIRSDVIPQIATGFCGGLSHTGGLCGAVSGALMGIGLAFGRKAPEDSRERLSAAVPAFLGRFRAQFGSLDCPELTGCDLGTPEGQAKFHAENRHLDCHRFVAEAARLAAALIEPAAPSQETYGSN
jgi:C_GCAxxG_C_C family probable redox protein